MALHISPLFFGLLICFVCLHCCWCQTTPSCSNTAPTKCSFRDTFCGWEPNDWEKSVNHTSATISNNPDHKATLGSQLACSTQNTPRCLRFQFYLFDHDPDSTLDVVVEDNNGNRKSIWRVKSSDSSGKWTTGKVTITTTSDFRVYFIAEWKMGQSPAISLRNVEVENTHCERSPSWASEGSSSEITSTPATTTKSNDTSGAEGYKDQYMSMRIPLLGIALSSYSFFFLWD